MKTKNSLFAVFSGVLFLCMIFFLVSFKTSSHSESYVAKPDWENLKVLPKDISKDSLNQLMKTYSVSLGVKCNHCHIPSKSDPTKLDFASDAKIEKEIARGMIIMTNDLNSKYFQPHFPDPKPKQVHVVNCVMCHRGTPNPEKYLSQMNIMYKTYDPNRDNRKEKILESGQWPE